MWNTAKSSSPFLKYIGKAISADFEIEKREKLPVKMNPSSDIVERRKMPG